MMKKNDIHDPVESAALARAQRTGESWSEVMNSYEMQRRILGIHVARIQDMVKRYRID